MIDVVGTRTLGSVLAWHASVAPERPFLTFEAADGSTRGWSYAAFDMLVDQTATSLRACGVGHGVAINLHLPNCPEFIALWFAAARLGAIIVPTNVSLTADEMAYIVDHSESVLIITQADQLATAAAVRQRCPRVRQLLCLVATADAVAPDGAVAWALEAGLTPDLPDDTTGEPGPEVTSSDVLALLYTSGTTAKPKGCLVTQAGYLYAGECMAKATRSGPTDRHLVVLPLFHAGAQTHSIMPALVSGAGVALMHRFSASRFFAQARRHGCTISDLFAAPIRMILNQPASPSDAQTSLRLVTFAQNITPAELERWQARCGVSLMQLWGMTETVGLPMMNPLDDRRDTMSLGLPVLGYQVRVIDEAGNDVAPGEHGQLIVAGVPGRTLMLGYFKDPVATAATLRDGWLYSGDVVELGHDGLLRFVDRAKDLIKRSGINISAGEIEAVIKQHPAIFDAAVVSVPDPIRDEAIVAFVIPREGQSIASTAIIDWCRRSLASYKLPEEVIAVADFPRTPVGKIQKHLLRDRATGHR